MKGLLWSIGVVAPLVIVGCGESVLDPHDADRSPRMEAASAPIEVPIFVQFEDVNPCSGLVITVTFTGTARIVEHNGHVVVHERRTISTSDGFEGRGTDTFVDNGNIQKFTLNDMLTNESGDRIRAHLLLVIDLSTTPPTVRVMKGTFGGTICVGA
ncbi:MAG: hypothetical protein ACJ8DC_19115 [Gemmatimonadales bacterium]